MDKVLFSILLMSGGFGVGLAGVMAWMHYRLYKLSGDAEHVDTILVKLGIVLTQGVLVLRLAQLQSADPSFWAWGYAIGLLVLTIGLARQVRTIIRDLATKEGGDK